MGIVKFELLRALFSIINGHCNVRAITCIIFYPIWALLNSNYYVHCFISYMDIVMFELLRALFYILYGHCNVRAITCIVFYPIWTL